MKADSFLLYLSAACLKIVSILFAIDTLQILESSRECLGVPALSTIFSNSNLYLPWFVMNSQGLSVKSYAIASKNASESKSSMVAKLSSFVTKSTMLRT